MWSTTLKGIVTEDGRGFGYALLQHLYADSRCCGRGILTFLPFSFFVGAFPSRFSRFSVANLSKIYDFIPQ